MTEPNPSLEELAAGAIDAADVSALDRIMALYSRLDPPPEALFERVQFGLTLDALHAEIAELQRSGDLAGVRSGAVPDVQTVTFTSASLTTMVTISALSADAVRIDGWVAPGEHITVDLRLADGSLRTSTDVDGRFVFESVPRGLAQFVLRTDSDADDASVVTPTIEF